MSESVLSITMPDRQPTLRVVPMQADANQNGDIFGGWIMSQVDIAGAVEAMRRARGRVVTVSLESFSFKQPVYVGDIISLFAEIISTGTTSIKVDVAVYAERNPTRPVIVKVTEAVLTYVAIDEQGGKRTLPCLDQ